MSGSDLPAAVTAAPEATASEPVATVVQSVPRHTSPTWELEIFISGGVVFSLFQLPPLVNALVTRWEPHATEGVRFALLLGALYVKSTLYTLIAAFTIHLGARAYWGGLLGLYSVFPNGIRWEGMGVGPITKEVYRKRLPALPRLIDSIDNFASIIFSFAFLVVFVFLISLVAIVGGIALYAVLKGFIPLSVLRLAAATLLFLLVVVPITVGVYDLKRGATLAPHGRRANQIRWIIDILYRTQLVGVSGPTLFTISSNTRRKTTFAVFYLAIMGSMFLALGEWISRSGAFQMSGTEYFSTRSEENALTYERYESRWTADYINAAAPSIQNDVITDPYVRLFIPYQIRRHDAALQSTCPGIQPIQKRGLTIVTSGLLGAAADSASARVLRCLARIHAVKLNGVALPDLRLRFATHPQTGIDGMVAYLPTSDLPLGENVISVMPPPRPPGSRNRGPLRAYTIPFWR